MSVDQAEMAGFVAEVLPEIGRIGLASFRTDLGVEDKGGDDWFDPVTEADRAIERYLRDKIAERYPDHRVVGEEYGVSGPEDATVRWVLDPIDGTRAYLSGVPAWGTLIGLIVDDVAVAGWLYQPYLAETFSAFDGQAWFERAVRVPDAPAGGSGEQRRALRTRRTTEVSAATMYTTTPEMFLLDEEERRAFERLASAVRLQRYGGDCYSYGMLAMGCVDLVVENYLQPYDIVALVPIIEAAGGVVTTRDGGSPLGGGFIVAAATPELHRQALRLLARQD